MIISKTAGDVAKPLFLICICVISMLAIIAFTFDQSKAANISGTVYYSISPVADIPLTLWDPQTNIRLTTFSDSNGHFYFNNVAAGYHELGSDFPKDDPLNLTYWEPAVG